MISVLPVKLEDLTDVELGLLVDYCRKCFEPLSYQDLVGRVRNGSAVIYRYSGVTSGIFILATGDNGLYVETVAGKGAVKHFDEIYRKIRVVATAAGAKNLYSFISRPSLRRLYDRKTDAEPVATLYRETLR